ncbi:MAG: aminotransferase class I/II-fold pyridoxal phosphate-dependent enzyme [Oscillospiraceae bacterium]|nr:aminotransferase class I/II-fold pyridoxal phosphate-dependent enzyme [Oscillospiraceae bacterium]
MNTPIYDFVKAYSESGFVRGHMPGHKGRIGSDPISALYPYDITEIHGADVLFEANGIIAESEKNASELFGTDGTFYSAGGSTLCIQAMLAIVCGRGGRVAAARNSHKAFINSCILLGIEPVWVYPEFDNGSVVGGKITAESVKRAIEENSDVSCVYITSPDYLGNIADIKAISEVCHSFGKPLLVDNAHGAHLAFLEKSLHPIRLGADICCDSAHKTLPVLTGGSYLHTAERSFTTKAKGAMSLFGSSSPSYLILQSLDLCNKYLAENFRSELAETVKRVETLKARLAGGYHICPSEPLKLTVYTLPCGRTGGETADFLRQNGIEAEYSDRTHIMLMFSPKNSEDDFERVYRAFSSMPFPRIKLSAPNFTLVPPKKAMPPRDAYFSEHKTVPVDEAEGKICAEAVTVCPPCVPILVGGEVFDGNSVKILKMYGISEVNVIQ